jgi:hypothetical protein
MATTAHPAIRFRFAARKALAALHLIVEQHEGIDLHAALKACYFADKDHLNQFGRPVFGATYRAMRYGPVPLEIYEMAKAEPLWLAELGLDDLPWELRGHRLYRSRQWNRAPDVRALSPSDREAITRGSSRACGMTFDERTAATHGIDWQAARLGLMRYEDMLDAGPRKAELVADLRESAPFMRL